MSPKVRVAILEDHQSIIDGYLYRLSASPDIEVVATARYGEEVEPMLASYPTDVLLLDVGVPPAPNNPNPYPIQHLLPKLLQLYPNLAILVISMYNQGLLIRAVVEAGANGYILKDDQAAIQDLCAIIKSVAAGGVYFSKQAHELLLKRMPKDPLLTSRQAEVLSLCAAYPDVRVPELAKRLCVANSTVRNLLSEAYLRLGVNNRIAAILKARKLGLIPPADLTYEF